MRPRIVDFLNDLFNTRLFAFIVPDAAVVYALMFTIFILVYMKRCKTDGLDRYHASGIAIFCAIGAILGSRLFFIIQNFGMMMENPQMLWEINGGLVSFGAYFGGIAGILLYGKLYFITLWPYADVIASVAGLGPFIGRWSCFLNGDDYGKLCSIPWGVRYPNESFPFLDQVNKGMIDPFQDLSLPLHPVQLYESLAGLFLFILFTWLWKKKYFKPGVLSILFWVGYAALRFLVEFYRGDPNRGFVGNYSTGQFMSSLILILCIAAFAFLFRFNLVKLKVNK